MDRKSKLNHKNKTNGSASQTPPENYCCAPEALRQDRAESREAVRRALSKSEPGTRAGEKRTGSAEHFATPLLDGIRAYQNEAVLRFHMPGHYGKMLDEMRVLSDHLFALDVTEVPGTDNLSEPEGIIKASLEQIAALYGAQRSYLLVNGSTSGIHIAVDALIGDGELVFVARNAHKSFHNIAHKKNLKLAYIYPRMDTAFGVDSHIEPQDIIEMIERHGRPAAVFLTYPNYYGRAYDLERIHRYLNEKNILLIVDSAHGASFAFSSELPESAVPYSDVCIHSLHKTLPVLTQSSVLHIGHTLSAERIEKIERSLRFYLSTSPSYILMLSAEIGLSVMKRRGERELHRLHKAFRKAVDQLTAHPNIAVYRSGEPCDFCKLFIRTPIEGRLLSEHLRRQYRIQCEMTLGNGILFMLGIAHTDEDIDYLTRSILRSVEELEWEIVYPAVTFLPQLASVDEAQKAVLEQGGSIRMLPIDEALGQICAEDIIPYPPGIPIAMPYEIISQELIELMKKLGIKTVACFE